jgi:hypothetical protein
MSEGDRLIPPDPMKVRELAMSAKDLLEEPSFKEATARLRKQWFDELIHGDDLSRDRKDELIAQLRALSAVAHELASMVSAPGFARRQGAHA